MLMGQQNQGKGNARRSLAASGSARASAAAPECCGSRLVAQALTVFKATSAGSPSSGKLIYACDLGAGFQQPCKNPHTAAGAVDCRPAINAGGSEISGAGGPLVYPARVGGGSRSGSSSVLMASGGPRGLAAATIDHGPSPRLALR